jgi:triphosphoribosyl-dephospho-CoA synthase
MKIDPSTLTSGQLAQVACLLEATARKPGNVHRFRDFDDAHYLDFLLSAAAIAGPFDLASETGLGRTILRAIESTRRLVATNTNLGMVLLLAPLALVPRGDDLRTGVERVLESTTIEDAALAYRAIRLAGAGGLGKVDEQDIAGPPTINLRDAMRLAADRDLVARQYALGFADVFDRALPTLRAAIERGRPLESAIIFAYLDFLAHRPDTLIARKRGEAAALEASARAASVLDRGWPDTADASEALAAFDDWLRLDGHARNPGATADLTTAVLFAALRDGTIRLPIPGVWSPETKN